MTKFPFFLPSDRRGNVCRVQGFGVIGNIKDSDSFVLGSRPRGPAKMASSYNGSIGDFDSFGVGSIPALAANVEVLRTRRELEKFGNRAV